ncbi:MAG: DNA internalization-related competence protein ComEC/Rec2 [Gammaproteobacteria bacterium]|nr:DNA internalization-related competence protein ComEC/Rec2 [Gammaproteobacteria bacterium]
MIAGTMAFVAGILSCLFGPPAGGPWPPLVAVIILLAVLALPPPRRWLPLFFVAGLLWCWLRLDAQLGNALPGDLDGRDLPARVTVTGLPEARGRLVRFVARVESEDPARPWRGRVRLSWYAGAREVKTGDRWRLVVRLKRPRGFANPGIFDYERWLFTRGILATGYVRSRERPLLLLERGSGGLHNLRAGLAARMGAVLAEGERGGMVVALGVGLREGIDGDEWAVLRRSGTAHLMAISGLHVGLVAVLAYGLGGFLWRRSAGLCRRQPAPRAAALAAVAAALAYALLAGFALPTQRAFIMVLALAGGALLGRRWPASSRLAVAALAVLLLDPFAVLGPGFWLSFGAVALILLGMGARVGVARRPWWRWGRVHLLVGLGLAPITAGAFGLAPLVSPLANLVAVPWVSVLVVPLTLLGVACLGLWPALGGLLLEGARLMLVVLWPLLDGLAGLGWELPGTLPPLAITAAVAGVVLLFAPRGLAGRWLGLVWLLPLLLAPHSVPREGEVQVTVLDVGQGLAAVVRTASHVLVFDTGPRFGSGSDTGDMVVAPYLQALGLGWLDVLMVSHGDGDHAGGVASVRRALTVERVMYGGGAPVAGGIPCEAGQGWRWDGVDFAVLHPPPGGGLRGNDGSCVLAVGGGDGRLLLTGDVEQAGEAALVAERAADLEATVLQVPHHGSRTSTTAPFLAAVSPSMGIIPVGFGNRFGFPHPDVVRRLEAAGVRLLDTATCGAITLTLTPAGPDEPECYRRAHPRPWRAGGKESSE